MSQTEERFEEYKNRGLTGLANMGNTCYVNSCIQILSNIYEFNDFLTKDDYKKKLNKKIDSVLLYEWDKLRKLIWSENCIISPGGFVNAIQKTAKSKGREIFTGYAQNDLPEFLLFLLDCFHNALSREVIMNIKGDVKTDTDKLAKECFEMMKNMYKNEYSEILNIFYGVHVSIIESIQTKEYLSIKPEPFGIINISFPPNIETSKRIPTLFECFEFHCQPEALTGENAYLNSKTNKKEDVYKKICYWSLPNILIIDLKRFEYNSSGNLRKIQVQIDIPVNNVSFSKYVTGYNKESYVYDLFGVCNHHGSIWGGHYTASVRNANGKWYGYNDTQVKELPITENITSNLPYCLFYRKKKFT